MKARFKSTLVIFFAAVTGALGQEFSGPLKRFVSLQKDTFAITHVTLVDGKGSPVQKDMTVWVLKGKIRSVEPSAKVSIPKGVYIIDGTGKTLIPGFVMLHEHIFYTKAFEEQFNVVNMTNTFPRMYLAGGVTTMRTAGSVSPHTDLNIKQLINDGKMIGPKMDVTGPFIERANGFGIPQLPILPKGQPAGATVDYWADMGCTSFKVYMHITKEDLRQVVDRAHARGFKVTGHLCSVTYKEAADIGIDNLEHGFMASSDFAANKPDDYCDYFNAAAGLSRLDKNDKAMDALMDQLITKGTSLTTTPAVFAPLTGYELILGGGEQALNPEVLTNIKNSAARAMARDSARTRMFNNELFWIKKFYDKGGKLVIGTDPTGAGRTIAGYANLWTLEILLKAGFTLPQAVMLCSLNGAKYLNRDQETGSIEKGKAADLILIDGDLTTDITLIRKIRWVFKDGTAFDSKALFDSVKGKVGLY